MGQWTGLRKTEEGGAKGELIRGQINKERRERVVPLYYDFKFKLTFTRMEQSWEQKFNEEERNKL